jgi:hypothetical protein
MLPLVLLFLVTIPLETGCRHLGNASMGAP